MRPVENSIKQHFPQVGDRLQIISEHTGTIETIVEILPCDHRPFCKRDRDCHYCLILEYAGRRSNNCWNRSDGTCFWRIVE